MELVAISYNYKKSVDWVIGAYEDADVTFANGFQKDAIQNCVGAKKSTKWNDWKCDISVIKNTKGTFIVVEDSGTYGLTGENRPKNVIDDMVARDETFPETERLSRFTSMYNSGGNSGPGLYGAGKAVYSVASNDYTYYFDSLRDDDGKYVANINACGRVMSTALEGEEAKEFILDETGFEPKKEVGTRIIIKNPKEELIQAIENGEIVSYVQESWWLIIQRLGENASLSVNGVPVTVPDDIKATTFAQEDSKPEVFAPGYKVKHFGLFMFPNGGNRWSGISYYRKGMKIGNVNPRDVDKKFAGRYWGYVEVDELWEDALSEIEDKVHFGVSKGKRNRSAYQYLVNFCSDRFRSIMTEWGFIKDKENEDKRLRDQLRQIAEEVQDLFDKLGYEDLGKGPQKADFDVRWQNIHYPVEGSEEVTSGDVINFAFRISSSYSTDKRIDYKILVLNPKSGELIHQIAAEKILLKSRSVFQKEFSYKILPDTADRYNENRIVLSVKVIGSGKEKHKELQFFYDIDKPDNTRDNVSLALHECIFPTEHSRRVDFGQSLKSVIYRVENKRNYTLKCRLNVSIHNANDPTCPKIVDVASLTGEVAPFEDILTPAIEEIMFDSERYQQFMTEGVLELRARLIALEDDPQYEKGERITNYNYKLFLNCDEKNGKKDSFETKSVDDPENYKRSWCEPGSGRTIYLNVGHTAYLSVADYPEIQHEYLREQMLKQFVLLYLAEGKYDMFGRDGEDFRELEPQEAVDRVMNKVESVYFQSLR